MSPIGAERLARMDPGDRAAAEGRQAARLGRPVSDLPQDLGDREAGLAGGLATRPRGAQAWHREWEAGVLAYGRGAPRRAGQPRADRAVEQEALGLAVFPVQEREELLAASNLESPAAVADAAAAGFARDVNQASARHFPGDVSVKPRESPRCSSSFVTLLRRRSSSSDIEPPRRCHRCVRGDASGAVPRTARPRRLQGFRIPGGVPRSRAGKRRHGD